MVIDHSALLKLVEIIDIDSKIKLEIKGVFEQPENHPVDFLINTYQSVIPHVESYLWQDKDFKKPLSLYYQLFQSLEKLYSQSVGNKRHHFVIVIPVADRPRHLQACLASLLSLCEKFEYGGRNTHRQFSKINVLIADDSQAADNIMQHKKIINEFNSQGLCVEYFGLKQQQQQLEQLSNQDAENLSPIIGRYKNGVLGHKGASMMRNITYLRLREIYQRYNNCLIYFIDSDQEFKINYSSQKGDKEVFSVNYFYYLDQIFSHHDVSLLTGKVVGDPPVSPSVMAGRFIDDVISFFKSLHQVQPEQSCCFHQIKSNGSDDGAYHDMADLFGLKISEKSQQYQCDLNEQHNHIQTFNRFSEKLMGFFDGEHPTRKTYFEFAPVLDTMQSARTVYTGNYIFKPECLKFFIPFASLKLRMAGPVLGRIIKQELGNQFVSANLPMLHRRTVESIGRSEYRAGISHGKNNIDLADEFERQFYGDVMLFSIESLYKDNGKKTMTKDFIKRVVENTEADLHDRYMDKQDQILNKISSLKSLLRRPDAWWLQCSDVNTAIETIDYFIHNMEYNFGNYARAYELINREEYKQQRLDDICYAILHYQRDRAVWQQVMNKGQAE